MFYDARKNAIHMYITPDYFSFHINFSLSQKLINILCICCLLFCVFIPKLKLKYFLNYLYL